MTLKIYMVVCTNSRGYEYATTFVMPHTMRPEVSPVDRIYEMKETFVNQYHAAECFSWDVMRLFNEGYPVTTTEGPVQAKKSYMREFIEEFLNDDPGDAAAPPD